MVIFDTNVWVAITNTDDSLHEEAMRELARVSRPVLLPEYILVETCNVLTYRAGKEFTDTFLEQVLHNTEVEMLYGGSETLHHATRFFQSALHKGLSFVDVFLLYLSAIHQIVTFDKQLERAVRKLKSTQ